MKKIAPQRKHSAEQAVKTSDWFKEYIDKALEQGLIKGITENKFAPNISMTRGMVITACNDVA